MTHDPRYAHITHRDGTVFQVLKDPDEDTGIVTWDEEATAKAYQEYEAAHPPTKTGVRKILADVREAFRPT